MGMNLAGIAGAVASTAASAATNGFSRATSTIAYVERMAAKAETLLDETTDAVRAARPVIDAMAEAVEDGMVDDMRTTVGQMQNTVGLVDRTTRAVQGTLPVVASLHTTQTDVRVAREAAEHLVGLVNTTIEQLDSLPGARLVRRRITRTSPDGAPLGEAPLGNRPLGHGAPPSLTP